VLITYIEVNYHHPRGGLCRLRMLDILHRYCHKFDPVGSAPEIGGKYQ
jgi:hypothetical protein